MKRFLAATAAIVMLAALGCGKKPEDTFLPPAAQEQAAPATPVAAAPVAARPADQAPVTGPLTITRVSPARSVAGQGFHVQPNGESAIALQGTNISRSTVIMFAGQSLKTTYGGPALATALVPPELLQKPGEYPVQLVDGTRKSEPATFTVAK